MRLCLVGSMFVFVGSHNPHLYEDVKKCRFYVCVLFSDWQIHTFPRNLYGTRCHVKYVHFPLPVLCISWGVYGLYGLVLQPQFHMVGQNDVTTSLSDIIPMDSLGREV